MSNIIDMEGHLENKLIWTADILICSKCGTVAVHVYVASRLRLECRKCGGMTNHLISLPEAAYKTPMDIRSIRYLSGIMMEDEDDG